VAYRWLDSGNGFVMGSFFLVSLLAWPAAAVTLADADLGRRRELLYAALPAFGAFLQVYPRADFQHFLFVFPLAALFLVQAFAWLAQRYPSRPWAWLHAPLCLLLILAVPLNLRLCAARTRGAPDPYGRISVGEAHALNQEMHAVGAYLRERGLQAGDPVLVLPNATHFYFLESFRNPTPHNQFFPGYVEAYGDDQENVLPEFERRGGRFIVFQKRSGTDRNVPVLYNEMLSRYRLAKDFPAHFAVWEKNP
jgi:hypothetical protein